MKSLYGRQFLLTAGMILISFALLGTSFIALTYRYTIQDTRNSMERNVDDVASFTGSTQEQGIGTQSKVYQIYIANIARIANAVVIIADSDGSLVLYADGSGDAIQDGLAVDHLPQSVMQTVLESGGYSGMSSLGGLFPERRFVSGTPIVVKSVDPFTGQTQQTVVGAAYMAARTSDITELWQAFISIFFFTAVVVLCISFITSSITSLRLTNPLKEIAEATRKFGHGEYEARVRGYERRRDEVGELAEAFNAMADSIAKSEEKRSEFVANISHELKTPMTTIAGFSDGILDGTIPPDMQNHYLQLVSEETGRLARLIQNMLDLSKLESGEYQVNARMFNIWETITGVALSAEQRINDGMIDIDGLTMDEKVLVYADPDLIHQVVYNLLDNAIKFTPAGGTIRFGVEKLGPEAEISIWNSGQGISPEALPYVFQRFYKEDRSRGLHARGAGLGLNICKVLVNLSGGQIRVESQQGEWCRFVFTLPTVAPNPGGMKRLPDEAGGEPTVEDPASMKPVE